MRTGLAARRPGWRLPTAPHSFSIALRRRNAARKNTVQTHGQRRPNRVRVVSAAVRSAAVAPRDPGRGIPVEHPPIFGFLALAPRLSRGTARSGRRQPRLRGRVSSPRRANQPILGAGANREAATQLLALVTTRIARERVGRGDVACRSEGQVFLAWERSWRGRNGSLHYVLARINQRE